MHLVLDSTNERKMTPLQLSEKPLPWAHVNFFRPVNLTIPSFPLKVALCQKKITMYFMFLFRETVVVALL